MRKKRTLPEFQAFCKSATRLQQLYMLGPKIEMETWESYRGLDVFLVRILAAKHAGSFDHANPKIGLYWQYPDSETLEDLGATEVPPR